MIIDRIDNADFYARLHPQLAMAFDILKDPQLAQREDGKYNVDGEKVYYTIQRYKTKPMSKGRLEAHKKYIDIQVVLSGREDIGYVNIQDLNADEPYDSVTDNEFFEKPEAISTAVLKPGQFCILFPQDAHMPCCHKTRASQVVKLVIKVRMV